jgi:eukaryotic-like serine/threonine-protein kinase
MRSAIYVTVIVLMFVILSSITLPSTNASWEMFRSDPTQDSNIMPYDPELMPKQNWTSFISPSGIYSSPAVSYGIIYIGTGDGNIYALNASSGEKIWNLTLRTGAIRSSPAVTQGAVYICTSEAVYALNAFTGTKIWSSPVSAYASSPAVVNELVYLGSSDGNVYALNASNGFRVWNYTTGSLRGETTVVANGVVYVGGGRIYRGIYALNASTGEKIWNHTTSWYQNSVILSTPAVADDMIFYAAQSNGLYALSLATGAELWHSGISATESSPTIANGKVLIGSFSFPNVHAFDAKSGRQLWTFSTQDDVLSSPAIVDGVAYFGSNDRNIYALDIANGRKIWNYSTGDSVISAPAVGKNEIFICSTDGNVYAIVGGPKTDGVEINFFLPELLLVVLTLIVAILIATFLYKRYQKKNTLS